MNWLSRLVGGNHGDLAPEVVARIKAWKDSPPADFTRPHFETRYVVVNTEATGLDLDKDRLLAVAAIAIDGGTLSPDNSVYAPLEEQPAEAMARLLEFAGQSPWVVFNAAFNRTLLEHAFDAHLGFEPEAQWIDLQWILPVLFQELESGQARLDTWMDAFGIETFQRHHALGDAYAIAQMLMASLGRGHSMGAITPRSLAEMERSRRWNQSAM